MDQSTINLSKYLSEEFSNTLFEKCVNQISGVTDICFLLCGLFSLAYFANILMKTWAKGESIDFHALLRPFIIGIITLNFSFVYGLVDGIFEPINQYTESAAKSNEEEMAETSNKLSKAKKEFVAKEKEKKESVGFWRSIFSINSATSFFDNLYINFIDLLLQGIQYIAGIAFGAVRLTIRATSLAFRIALIVFGPFAFALSVLPVFKDNWKSWLSKYVNVCLFIPIANLMDVIINQLHDTMLCQHIEIYQSAIHKLSYDIAAVDSTITTITISYVIFLLAFVVLYMMIPSIASYIVNSAGMDSLTGGITLAGAAAASKLISNTANNPLTPNILRLFTRNFWRRKSEVMGSETSTELVRIIKS